MFTEKEFVQTVRDEVREAPHNCYRSDGKCCYTRGVCDNGSIGCLFGQVLLKHHTIQELEHFDSVQKNAIDSVLKELGYDFSRQIVRWAMRIQELQDEERTWSYALTIADNDFGDK